MINNYREVIFPANDDGTWPCGGDGDASPECPGPEGQEGPEAYPLGFDINLFGSAYSAAYINTNGNVTFGEPLSQYTPSALASFSNPIVAPFFADVDTRGAESGLVNFGDGTLNGKRVFVVNWPDVGCFDENASVLDDFQLILIDRPDKSTGPFGDDFEIEFNYDSIQWDAGEASGGSPQCQEGPEGESAYVGYSNGTEVSEDSYTLTGSGVPQAFLDSTPATGLIYHELNSTTPGRYIFAVNAGQPAAPTVLTTSLSGGGQSGAAIVVAGGTDVTDSATLSGEDAASATGTVTYDVYSDAACTDRVDAGTPETIATPGTLPESQAVDLTTPGQYYWQVVYSGDTANNGSVSTCSPSSAANEVETVEPESPAQAASRALGPPSQTGGVLSFSSAVLAPQLAVSGDVALVSGQVSVRLPGTGAFVALSALRQIPFGTVIEATHGRVRVTTVGPHGGTQTGEFFEGEFVLRQGHNGMVVAELTGGDFSVCPTARERGHLARASSAHASGKYVARKLWADAHGSFGTKGNYASATVEGTEWLTEDLCVGTLVRVTRDKVAVTNLVNHRHVTVEAGHRYLAKAP